MEREQEQEPCIVVQLGERTEAETVLSLVLCGSFAIWCLASLLGDTTDAGPAIPFGLLAAWQAWRSARQTFGCDVATLSSREIRLLHVGFFRRRERVYDLSEVSGLEVERRHYREGRHRRSRWMYRLRFLLRGEIYHGRRALDAREAALLEQAIDELEACALAEAESPRSEPLVFRGGLRPSDLHLVER